MTEKQEQISGVESSLTDTLSRLAKYYKHFYSGQLDGTDREDPITILKEYRTEQCRKVLLAAADHSIGMFLGAGEYLRKIANDPGRLQKLMEAGDG